MGVSKADQPAPSFRSILLRRTLDIRFIQPKTLLPQILSVKNKSRESTLVFRKLSYDSVGSWLKSVELRSHELNDCFGVDEDVFPSANSKTKVRYKPAVFFY
jgi:hypothetical protein